MENLQRIAVLIDADNTQLTKLEAMLYEVSTYGRIVVKKAYGNWKKQTLKNWESEVKRLAIKTEQQFDYISGKNTTDIVMVIDAMDLLHEKMYDAFVLVSSDSDFTPLAIRLRESGAYIIGAGEKKTPEAFKNACDDFILLEYVAQVVSMPINAASTDEVPTDTASADEVPTDVAPADEVPTDIAPDKMGTSNIEEIHNLLKIASDKYQDDDGFINVAAAGSYIKRVKPDFTPLIYGFSKLPELLKAFPEKYTMTKSKGKGKVNIVAYKCL